MTSPPRRVIAGGALLLVACGVAPASHPTTSKSPRVSASARAIPAPSIAPVSVAPTTAPHHSSCEEDTLILYAPIQFPAGSATPFEEASSLLDVFACKLRSPPEFHCRVYAIIGHADPAEEHPDELARARAERVVLEFTRRGVDSECLRAESAGAREPATDGHSNRRVTFRPIDP